ncbi:MAG: hypothetical protein RIR18_440 [Pseudomonadota bacterium]
MNHYPIFPIKPETTPVTSVTHSDLVQGIAKVVGVDGNTVWLEPEQTSSCGHCASSSSCSSGHQSDGSTEAEKGGMGTITSRLHTRRFQITQPKALGTLLLGDRIIVGIESGSLLKAAMTAYGLPLLTALIAGSIAQEQFAQDAMTMLGTALGLTTGMVIAHFSAKRLKSQGALAPHVLRRASAHETCGTV